MDKQLTKYNWSYVSSQGQDKRLLASNADMGF